MNIFFLDRNHARNASYYVNAHVIKMPLEHVQMLSTCIRHYNGVDQVFTDPDGKQRTFNLLPGEEVGLVKRTRFTFNEETNEKIPHEYETLDYTTKLAYSSTHFNHPCTAWIRESVSNYDFLIELTLAINDEKKHRYPRPFDVYKVNVLKWIQNHPEEVLPWMIKVHGKQVEVTDSIIEIWRQIEWNHASVNMMLELPRPKNQLDLGLTRLPEAMPIECIVDDPVQSYRNYYNMHKQHLAQWKHRDTPPWFTPGVETFSRELQSFDHQEVELSI